MNENVISILLRYGVAVAVVALAAVLTTLNANRAVAKDINYLSGGPHGLCRRCAPV